jgi:type II secretory pathway pseudopilin PulG
MGQSSAPQRAVIGKASKQRSGLSVVELVVVVTILGLLSAAFFLTPVRSGRSAAQRTQCMNNLRNIALALINYHENYQALPPAYTVDATGRRLHSWRTLILPYLDQGDLYKKIDLSKPWNDPANAAANKRRVSQYQCASINSPENHTTYLAVVGSNTCLLPAKSRVLSKVFDDRPKAIIVIEVDAKHAVHWMDPSDANEELVLSLGPKDSLAHGDRILAAFLDGTVQSLNAEISAAERRELISVSKEDKSTVAAKDLVDE